MGGRPAGMPNVGRMTEMNDAHRDFMLAKTGDVCARIRTTSRWIHAPGLHEQTRTELWLALVSRWMTLKPAKVAEELTYLLSLENDEIVHLDFRLYAWILSTIDPLRASR